MENKIRIKKAIKKWVRMSKGLYYWWQKERYTIDFCKEQIEYFKARS